jgi:hypothetical protein
MKRIANPVLDRPPSRSAGVHGQSLDERSSVRYVDAKTWNETFSFQLLFN